jgi:hypothetical protein
LLQIKEITSNNAETPRCLFNAYFCRGFAQTIRAQAVLAVERHRQPRGFLGAPARSRQAAGEFRSASGTAQAARGRHFQPICHQANRILAAFFM